MNRSDVIAKMATDAGISKAKAESALNGLIDGIAGALRSGDKVSLVGFGTFSVSDRAARTGRNPIQFRFLLPRFRDSSLVKVSKTLSNSLIFPQKF